MRKSAMLSLEKGMQIQHKRNGQVLTVIEVKDNEIVCEERTISVSNCTRWFDVVEIPEVVEPDNTILDDIEQADELTSEQDTTADTEQQEDTDTTATTATNIQVNELSEDTDTTPKTHTTEGNTATTNSTEQTNTVQPTIQQRNLMTDISNLVDLHGANLVQRKEYIGVYKEGYKGCIAMIRRAKYGGLHIDMKQKIWNALDEDYKKVVSKEHYTGIYDKSRKLFRIGYVSDLDILEVVICTALHIAS